MCCFGRFASSTMLLTDISAIRCHRPMILCWGVGSAVPCEICPVIADELRECPLFVVKIGMISGSKRWVPTVHALCQLFTRFPRQPLAPLAAAGTVKHEDWLPQDKRHFVLVARPCGVVVEVRVRRTPGIRLVPVVEPVHERAAGSLMVYQADPPPDAAQHRVAADAAE